jgi:hypothetical protein
MNYIRQEPKEIILMIDSFSKVSSITCIFKGTYEIKNVGGGVKLCTSLVVYVTTVSFYAI